MFFIFFIYLIFLGLGEDNEMNSLCQSTEATLKKKK